VDSELGHEAIDHAKDSDVLEVSDFDEIIEPVRAFGSPGAGDFDDELSLGGIEFDFERSWCCFGGLFGGKQSGSNGLRRLRGGRGWRGRRWGFWGFGG